MIRSLFKVATACLMVAGLSSLVGCNGARDDAARALNVSGNRGFVQKTLTNEGRTRQYAVFLPANYSPDRKWPAIMFLHGVGEAGSDIKAPLRVGLAPFVADRMNSFPFIVIFPQSSGGWEPDSDNARDAIAALEQAKRDYSIDPDRVSLTGLSTGGYGTFAIGGRYSHLFAALVPMCPSGGHTGDAQALAKMNIWAIENAMDPFVAPLSMASSLGSIKSAGGNPKHTVYPAMGHDCWPKAYSDPQLFDWMLQQRRNGSAAAPASKKSTSSMSVKSTPVAANTSKPAAASTGSRAIIPATPY
jgi:predicted peptidase